MLDSIFNYGSGEVISLGSLLLCCLFSIVLGSGIAFIYRFRNKEASKTFLISLIILPVLVQFVIMLVNGSIGLGITIAGAFALVRFRSAQGTAKEITFLFFALAIGLACGTGYVGYATILFIIIAVVMIALSFIIKQEANVRSLKITIPETLNYTNAFDDIFEKYTTKHSLMKSKTVNLGSLYELSYDIILKDITKEKEMIDEIRVRNANLSISCAQEVDHESL